MPHDDSNSLRRSSGSSTSAVDRAISADAVRASSLMGKKPGPVYPLVPRKKRVQMSEFSQGEQMTGFKRL